MQSPRLFVTRASIAAAAVRMPERLKNDTLLALHGRNLGSGILDAWMAATQAKTRHHLHLRIYSRPIRAYAPLLRDTPAAALHALPHGSGASGGC